MSEERLLPDPRGQNMRDLSARTLDEVRAVPTERIKKALRGLEDALGGREELARILAHGSFANDEEKFVAILADPEADGTPLATLLGTFGLSPARFFKLLSEAKMIQATFASMDHVYRRLPDVAAHTMERALPGEEPCDKCGGIGHLGVLETGATPPPCGECKGKGTIKRTPTLDEVKLALQVGGLMKGGGSVVNVNQQVDARSLTVNGASRSPQAIFKDFTEASDRVLYGRVLPEPPAQDSGPAIQDTIPSTKDIVDAEITAPEAPDGG